MKVFQAISDAVKSEEVQVAFALMGDANQNLIVDLAERHGIQIVNFRHEQNAVAAADGYARFSDGKLGVALVTAGPGLTNTATSLVAARVHRSPVLVFAGATSVGELHSPQRFDQVAFSQLLAGAGAILESSSSLAVQLDLAFGRVRRQSGPFVLNLPSNIQNADAPEDWSYRPGYSGHQPTLPSGGALGAAARILAEARSPAILAGRGAVRGRATTSISELASYLQAPIASTLPAKGICSDHPLWVGASGGLGEGVALPCLAASDVLLVVGASLNQWTTHHGDLTRGKVILQIDADLEAFGNFARADVVLNGDTRETVQALLECVRQCVPFERNTNKSLHEMIEIEWQKFNSPISYETCAEGTIDPRQAVREIDRLLPVDRLVVAAGGHAGYLVCQMLKVNSPENWNYTIDFGALGQGLATAIGAAFARPGQRIYHLTGDGEFMMNISDFHTAVAYKLPMTIIILNDQGFGQERHDLEHKNLPIKYAMQASPDFAKLAEGFGAAASASIPLIVFLVFQRRCKVQKLSKDLPSSTSELTATTSRRVSQEIAKALA